MQRSRWLLIAIALAAIGAVYFFVVRNDSPTFTLDRTQPFWLEFGRGSGWHGLDTVKLDQTGQVILHRMNREQKEGIAVLPWETSTLHLPPESLAEVMNAVESNNLMGLRKAYQEDIHDGTQWVLWIKQGDQEKSVYFDNNFPSRIKAFAEELDAILARAGSNKAEWQPVPEQESRQHERALWESIK